MADNVDRTRRAPAVSIARSPDLWRHVAPQPDLNPCHRDDGSSTHAELVDEPVQDRGAHASNRCQPSIL